MESRPTELALRGWGQGAAPDGPTVPTRFFNDSHEHRLVFLTLA
jgi:hypothetical protein